MPKISKLGGNNYNELLDIGLKKMCEGAFATAGIVEDFYSLKHNSPPFAPGNSVSSSITSDINDLSPIGERYETFTTAGGDSYTFHFPATNIVPKGRKYQVTILLRGVDSSVGKTIIIGAWTGAFKNTPLTIPNSWQFVSSDPIQYEHHENIFNIYLRFAGQGANMEPGEQLQVGAFFIKQI